MTRPDPGMYLCKGMYIEDLGSEEEDARKYVIVLLVIDLSLRAG